MTEKRNSKQYDLEDRTLELMNIFGAILQKSK